MSVRRHKVARAQLPGGGEAHFDLGPDPSAPPARAHGVLIVFDEETDPVQLDRLAEVLEEILRQPPSR